VHALENRHILFGVFDAFFVLVRLAVRLEIKHIDIV